MTDTLTKHLRTHSLLIILIGCGAFGFGIYRINLNLHRDLEQNERASFQKATFLIVNKVNSFTQGLQGMGGVYLTNDFSPTPQKVRSYASYRNFFNNFEGAMGFGFVRYVPDAELKAYIKGREAIDPRFKYHVLGPEPRKDHFVIEVIEPWEKNQIALGLDVGSEAARRDAAELAARTGVSTITAPIQLVQTTGHSQGFLIYLPLYSDGTTSPKKTNRLIGWNYAPFTTKSLVNFLKQSIDPQLQLRIHDSTQDEIYSSSTAQDEDEWLGQEIEVGQRRWRVRGKLKPTFLHYYIDAFAVLTFFLLSAIHTVLVRHYFGIREAKAMTEAKNVQIQGWLNAVLDGSTYSIISTNLDGVITTFNRSAELMLGYSADEMVGKQTPAVFHSFDEMEASSRELTLELGFPVPVGFESFVAKARRGKSHTRQWTYVTKDGARIPVRLCVTPIYDTATTLIGFLGVAEDLTLIQKLEADLELQRSKMVAASKMSALGEMASGVAHEINNPLAIITSWTELLKTNLATGSPDQELLQKGVTKIEQTAFRIAKIIKGLRNFSRDSSNDPIVETSANKIIADTLDLCQEKLKKENVSIEISGDLEATFFGRPVQLSQVLLNLIGNSVDAMEHLKERWLRLQVSDGDQFVEFALTDAGCGIPPAVEEKMMQPFFTTKDVGKGTGLGLSISHSIVDQHRGRLYYRKAGGHTQMVFTVAKQARPA